MSEEIEFHGWLGKKKCLLPPPPPTPHPPPPPPPHPQVFFSGIALSHFFGIIYNNVNGRGIPCGPKSSYSFIQIRSKVHWCFVHGLKICMWIGYNPLINFIISNLSLTFITLPAFFAFSAINILSMSIYM